MNTTKELKQLDIKHASKKIEKKQIKEVLDAFLKLNEHEQDQFLLTLTKECGKRQLSFMANYILPQLRVDILGQVPHEIALTILSYLPVQSLCRLSTCCQYYRHLIMDDQLWKKIYSQEGFMDSGKSSMDLDISYKSLYKRHYLIQSNWNNGNCTHFSIDGPTSAIVTCLQFHQNLLVIATDNSNYGLIEIYDGRNGTKQRRLSDHEGGVWALEFRGDTLISGGCDRDLRIWDLKTGFRRFKLPGHTSTIRCLKIVDDHRVITGSRDKSLRIWDYRKGICLKVLLGHESSIRCLDIHGDLVVSGSYDSSLRVWQISTGKLLHVLEGHHAQIYSVFFDGRFICSGSLDADVRVWDPQTGQCLHTFDGHDALVGNLLLKGDTLVSAGSDGKVCIWNLKTGELEKRIAAHRNAVTAIQFDKNRIVTGGDDGVKIWDTKTGKLIRTAIESTSGIWRLDATETKLLVAVQRGSSTSIEIMDFEPITQH